MDTCPNCNQAVALDATRCQACGLPRNLPVFDEDGTFLGTGFARPQRPPTPQTVVVPAPQSAAGPSAAGQSAAGQQGPGSTNDTALVPRRRMPLAMIMSVCGAAVLLGVVAAVIGYQVIYAPGQEAAGAPDPTPTAGRSSNAATTPTPTPTPSPTPSPTPAADYEAVFAKVSSGVVQVMASTCTGTGIGTGFLVTDRTVVTSFQSVAGAVSTVVRVGTEVTGATVVGGSQDKGIAILTLEKPLDGHTFSLADEWAPTTGDAYGSAGVPSEAKKPSLTEGEVSELDVATSDSGVPMDGLVRLDGDYDPGLAGGPVLDADGRVAGALVGTDGQTDTFALPVDALASLLDDPAAMETGNCRNPLGPDIAVEISGDRGADLEHYFTSINTGDYEAAYSHLGPAIRKSTSKKKAIQGWVSTYDFNITAKAGSNGRVHVTFDSIFAKGKGPEGLTCATWSLDYKLEGSGDDTVIRASLPHKGDPYRPC